MMISVISTGIGEAHDPLMDKFLAICLSAILIAISATENAFADKGKHKGSHKHHAPKVKVHKAPKVIHHRTVAYNRQPVNQPILAHNCPFSCATQGVPKAYCKDWREGNLCFVQVLRSSVIPYKVVSIPSPRQRYYLVDPSIVEIPNVTLGEIIGEKIGKEIDRKLR